MFALLAAVIAASNGPTFIENDYPLALAKAKASKKLLFVDAWAPWCHSCVYLREHVTNQPAFKAFEKEVVFSSIDTEQAAAAGFLEKYPVTVWPTLFFIDPVTETVRFRWAGSVDAPQMAALLEAAQQRDAKLVEGDLAFANGDAAEAAKKLLAARERGDESVRGAMSLVGALGLAKQYELCVKTSSDALASAKTRSDTMFFVTSGLGCALELPESPAKAATVAQWVNREKEMIAAPEGLMADDLSSGYELLVNERQAAKDDAGAVALGLQWQQYLDGEAAKAKTPAARAAFDAHRTLAAIAAKTPAHMVAPLKQSEKELPKDYNAAARLSAIYRELNQLDDAKAAIDRALAKCQGPRKLGLYQSKAKTLAQAGDAAGHKKALEAALAYAKTLPKVQQSPRAVASIEAQLQTSSK